MNEICNIAEAQRYEVTLLRIINVQLCEKLRYVAKADVVLLTHGSDYFIAAMARARCLRGNVRAVVHRFVVAT